MASYTESTHPQVAVLLATFNGARFIEPQIASLKANAVAFTAHWLDDQSTDNSRQTVRNAVSKHEIELHEWHRQDHQGLAGAFFSLVECVEADIYLFCDQDDIWQPGKIDATVANLLPALGTPALCYSDPLLFNDNDPGNFRRLTTVMGIEPGVNEEESRLFTYNPATGHTIGFTRPLREIFLRHKEIARTHAFVHDWWMHLIALASGTSRMLSDAPTTLYRIHGNNAVGIHHLRRGFRYIPDNWRLHQMARRWISRQAEGFRLAAATLPSGPKLERLVSLAELTAAFDRRQSLGALARMARYRAMPASRHHAFWLAATCLWSDAPV